MNRADLENTAAALIDGGWDAEDKDEFAAFYNLTEEKAEEIAEEMRRLGE